MEMMVSPAYGRTMARYNAWMNARLYDGCARLSDADRKQDARAFFKSIHGTLNHLLLADRIWMGRFLGRPFAATSLAQELYADFEQLRAERAVTDLAITTWAGALTDNDLAGELIYTTIVNPSVQRHPLGFAVMHFFNPQTHHRGQLTNLLFQRGIDPGVTDLLWLPGTAGTAA
jgi:uncharacterized damage-inducible protein DinB